MSGMSNFEIKTVMVIKEDLINDINSNFFLWSYGKKLRSLCRFHYLKYENQHLK